MAAITAFIEKSDVHERVKPYMWDGPDIALLPRSNFNMKDMELNLTDMRTVPDFKPTIEDDGFCFLQNRSEKLAEVTSKDNCRPYLEEMVQLLKQWFDTDEVWAINAKFRGADLSEDCIEYALFAHVDNTLNTSWERISTFLTLEERERVLSNQTRARVINIWRPMKNHAEDFPFAVCEPKTVTDLGNIVAVDRVSPEACKELAYFTWSPDHRWYWLSNQTPDEIVVLTQYDTHPPGGMFNIVPHAAFRNSAASPDCPRRQSIEARFIVLQPAPYQKEGHAATRPSSKDDRAQPWREFVTLPQSTRSPSAPTASNRPFYF